MQGQLKAHLLLGSQGTIWNGILLVITEIALNTGKNFWMQSQDIHQVRGLYMSGDTAMNLTEIIIGSLSRNFAE